MLDGRLNIKIPAYPILIQGIHGIWSNDPKIHMKKARIVKIISKENKMRRTSLWLIKVYYEYSNFIAIKTV